MQRFQLKTIPIPRFDTLWVKIGLNLHGYCLESSDEFISNLQKSLVRNNRKTEKQDNFFYFRELKFERYLSATRFKMYFYEKGKNKFKMKIFFTVKHSLLF